MKLITSSLLTGLLIAGSTQGASILYDFENASNRGTPTITGTGLTSTDYDPRSTAVGGDDSGLSTAGNTFMRAQNTPNGTSPVGNNFYHTFELTVSGIVGGQTLDLTSLTVDYFAQDIFQNFFLGVYSDKVGYTGTSDKLATTNISSDAGDSFTIDLTSANAVAGTSFTGLSNGDTAEFRFYFGENSTSNNRIHRLDNIQINATVVPEPSSSALLGLGALALMTRRRK